LRRWEPAAIAYAEALHLATQDADRQFLLKRLAEVETNARADGRGSSA
jgi:predicted RNA polymerase sigma factor